MHFGTGAKSPSGSNSLAGEFQSDYGLQSQRFAFVQEHTDLLQIQRHGTLRFQVAQDSDVLVELLCVLARRKAGVCARVDRMQDRVDVQRREGHTRRHARLRRRTSLPDLVLRHSNPITSL